MDESMVAQDGLGSDHEVEQGDHDHQHQHEHHHHHHHHHHHQTPSRTRSGMSETEQKSRRESIKEIMADQQLSAVEKRKSIQSLMDGRRRSSTTGCSISSGEGGASNDYVSTMAAAAAAAAEYYDSSDDDMLMSDAEDDDDDNDDNDNDELRHNMKQNAKKRNRNNNDNTSIDGSLNPVDTVFVGGRRASATSTVGDSSVSQNSLGYGAGRRGSVTSSSGNDSHRTLQTDGSANSNSNSNHNHHSSQNEALDKDDHGDDDVSKRVRRYGRARSLQDFGDGAFAAAAAAAASFVKNDPRAINKRMEKSRPKCEHYERQCTIVSPCCGLAFGCRICHDECPVLPPPINTNKQKQLYDEDVDDSSSEDSDARDKGVKDHSASNMKNGNSNNDTDDAACSAAAAALNVIDHAQKKTKIDRRRSMPIDLEEEETHHEIDRFAIREVICRNCYTRQSSKTNKCVNCGVKFGEYHCDICNLWMSDKESPYHCHDCGFCRVGGRENFKHCNDCGMCIDALLFDDHNCKVGKYMSNCPVCQEDLFSSRYASHEMPCGHAIHWHCFKELTSYDTRCPVCKKTAETADQMAATWSAMAMGIALQPVPADLARVVTIVCYDCEQHDGDRRWHFLGVRCLKCMSFNTTVERTTMMGRDAAVFLDELSARRERNGRSGNGAPPNENDAAIQQQREVEMQLQGMHMINDADRDNTGNGDDGDDNEGDDFMEEAG